MSIIRVKKAANYFAASNEPFNDERLSWEARGLMGYLLSKPNDWKVQQKDIMNKGIAGERKVKRMLAELRKAGYMNRIRVTLEHNKFDWITEVYESPSQNPRKPKASFIKSKCDVLHSLEKPPTGKRTDIVITELQSTKELNVNERAQLLQKLYKENIGAIVPIMIDLLRNTAIDYPDSSWYAPAFEIAVTKSARNWKYVETVLKNWKEKGRGWSPVVQTYRGNGKKKPAQSSALEVQYDYAALRKFAAEAMKKEQEA
jgi:DnaD/phage-associated family protein